MKSSKKIGLISVLLNLMCVACVPISHAQTRGGNDSLMLSSGGFLWNRAAQYTNLSKFKGDVRDSIADAPLIRQVLFEAQQAQVNNRYPSVDVLQRKSDSLWNTSHTLYLQYFAAEVNRYQDSSLFVLQNWDTLKRCFVYPLNSKFTLQTDTLVLLGSLLDSINQASFSVVLDSAFIQKNWRSNLQLFVSLDDTLHYNPIVPGNPLNLVLDSTYALHRLHCKAYNGNKVLYSSSQILYTKSSIVFPNPDQIIAIHGAIPFKGQTASLEIGVWKSCLNTVGFNQPVLIVEGFDPQNSRSLLSTRSAANNLYCISNASVANNTNMLDSLRAYGHDVLIVDFIDGGTYVEQNALALVEALNYINANKEGKDELAIVGASMGGLVTRYALLYMERHQTPHHCRLWVSFDSPHQGANVPIGLQMMIDFIYNNLSQMPYAIQKQVPPLRDAVLNCPAAREMLLTHYTQLKLGSNQPCPEFYSLYDTLNAWGFPNCRKLSLSDGNYFGGDQGFAAGQQLVHFLLPAYPLIIDMKANAVPQASQTQSIFDATIKLFVKGLPVNLAKSTYTLNGGNGIDNAAGGSNSFHIDVAKSLGINYGQSTLGNCLMQEDNFVPTQSALAIQNGMNYQTPISALMPNLSYKGKTHATTVSPFDVTYCLKNYYSSTRNSTINNAPHILGGFDKNMMQIVSEEVMSRDYYLQNVQWDALHEVEAMNVEIGANVSSWFLSGDFHCKPNADASIIAVNQIHLQDGVRILHPVKCHLTSQATLFDVSCIQVASTQAYKFQKQETAIGENVGILQTQKLASSIQVQPNPSTARFVLKFERPNAGIQVIDIYGKLIYVQHGFNSGEVLDLNDFPDGIYFVSLLGNPLSTTKIIKLNYE